MRQQKKFAVFGFLILLVAAAAFGQTTAVLTGTVTSEGKALPGATVTISSPALQGTRTTVTGETGGYNFSGLNPGLYTVRVELSGLSTVTRTAPLSLAQTSRVDADLKVSGLAEAITVTASAPAVLETTQIARNFTAEQITKLPVARTITGMTLLAPGVSSSGVNNQITISGAPSAENLFLVNGVVVGENLRGQPRNLFIEDALQETTVLTGGISAEYGRFTGGVVTALTKSGGNEFSGSFRDSLTNPNWRAKTPVATEADHVDVLDNTYEATLGGYLWRDRLWFFGAGRTFERSDQRFTRFTNLPYVFGEDETRLEGKLTGQVTPRHSLVGSYLEIERTEINSAFLNILDADTIDPNRLLPDSLTAFHYNGVITSNLLVEGQYSERKQTFVSSGGTSTDRLIGTWLYDLGRAAFANAPVFCGVCNNDEGRDNNSWVAKATYYLNTASLGTHNVVLGVENYAETRSANNFQSASQFEMFIGGGEIVNSQWYPRFDTGTTFRYRPIFELSTGTDYQTQSLFLNDKWDLNNHFSFNVGARFDKNDGHDASGNLISDDSAISPRLGLIFDLFANGRHRLNLNYGTYVTKIADGNVGGGGQAAGNPSLFSWTYRGTPINPTGTPASQLIPTRQAMAQVFAWFDGIGGISNRNAADGYLGSSIAGFTTEFPDPLQSPGVDEITLGYGVQVRSNGFARVDLVSRDYKNFYAGQLDLTTGKKADPEGNNGDLSYTINEDSETERTYRGVQLYSNFRLGRFNMGGGYTWSELKGNDVGEGAGTATIRNIPLSTFYPEYLSYPNRRPSGFLGQDQTHRARVWAGYEIPTPFGSFDISVLERFDSGAPYSAIGNIDASGRIVTFEGLIANPGYIRNALGTSHDYFFSDRGEFRADNETNTDLSLNYTLPIWKVQLFASGQLFNAFDEDAVVVPNATVRTRRNNGAASGLIAFNPFTATPIECPQGASAATCTAMGAHWQKATTFGTPTSTASYQIPRTYQVSLGLRF